MLAAKQGEHTCTRCQEIKPHTSFNKDSSRRLGIRLTCKACQALYRKAHYAQNAETQKLANRAFYKDNADLLKQKTKDWKVKNKDRVTAYDDEYRAANAAQINKTRRERYACKADVILEQNRKWRAENPRKTNLRNAKYRVQKKNMRRPFDDEFLRLVEKEAYDLSIRLEKLTKAKWNVDHIVPISGPKVQGLDIGSPIPRSKFFGPLVPIVSGIHNEFNLAVIPKIDNVRKGNRFWPNMP